VVAKASTHQLSVGFEPVEFEKLPVEFQDLNFIDQ
jgi:hypothetical protein